MHSTVAHLTRYAQIDFSDFAKQEAVRADFRRKMAACDPEYLKNWDAGRTGVEELQNSANQLEHDWFASVTALYSYGEKHARQIKVKAGKISISEPTVRQKFDDLFRHSKALHEKLDQAVQEEVQHQRQAKAHIAG